jgi:hypothetical protein
VNDIQGHDAVEEDRTRALRAAVEQLLTGVMEMRADAEPRGELARAELGRKTMEENLIRPTGTDGPFWTGER